MKMSTSTALLLATVTSVYSFSPSTVLPGTRVGNTAVFGYLDDLTKELYSPEDTPDIERTHENLKLSEDQKENYGPAGFEDYVDFGDEFDGGDGQMGVAGDGNKSLEKIGGGPQMGMKSKTMSAKNAWGTSTGYAEKLADEGMDIQKAQRLENWQNQQAVRLRQLQHQDMTDSFDQVRENAELDWRELASFGAERVEDFDLDKEFGVPTAGEDVEIISLKSRLNKIEPHYISLKNELMGFADFRAAFTPDSSMAYVVTPIEGALKSSEATEFIVRFRPDSPGVSEATLVIETTEMKKTYKFIGSTG